MQKSVPDKVVPLNLKSQTRFPSPDHDIPQKTPTGHWLLRILRNPGPHFGRKENGVMEFIMANSRTEIRPPRVSLQNHPKPVTVIGVVQSPAVLALYTPLPLRKRWD
jgi:hypothetical protein